MNDYMKRVGMAVSAYDRAASWVVSLNILVSSAVLLAFLIWLTPPVPFIPPPDWDKTRIGRGDHAAGYAWDVEAPGIEELTEETEPELEQLLDAMTDLVSTQVALLDTMQTNVFSSHSDTGNGDRRPPGELGESDTIPEGERWEIRYNANSLQAYAQQLDHFKIELGAVGGGEPLVDYAVNFGKTRPNARRGPGDKEKRLYLLWTAGVLKKFDERLLQSAGVKTSRRIVVQFYPKSVVEALVQLEKERAERDGKRGSDGRDVTAHVKKTVFGVRRKGAGFEYYVISIRYRAVSA